MFQQYVAIINLLRSRATIDLVPPDDRKVTQQVSKTLTQHPLVLLDQQLKSLVKEDDDAIIQGQSPGLETTARCEVQGTSVYKRHDR
jgi:hypothetical protein